MALRASARNKGFQNLPFGRTDAVLAHSERWTFQFVKGMGVAAQIRAATVSRSES